VIVALVVGDQRGIDQADWQVFNRTGIGHLISISGLHITMIAGLFALAASSLWRCSFFTRAQLPLLLPAQKVAALVGAAVALLYVLLAGFGVPAQRTLVHAGGGGAALWMGGSPASRTCCARRWAWWCCSIRGPCCGRASGCRSARWP
jgi:competence protein ComEC